LETSGPVTVFAADWLTDLLGAGAVDFGADEGCVGADEARLLVLGFAVAL
jgi:hypothetical protein